MLTLILLIASSAVLITGAIFAMLNHLLLAELAKEVARLCRKIEPDASSHYIRTEPWVFDCFDPGTQF